MSKYVECIIRYALLIGVFLTITDALEQYEATIGSFGKNEELVPRIANGTIARQKRFPWNMAVLCEDEVVCAAALITTKTALSAAHCFDPPFSVYTLHGRIGNVRLSKATVVEFAELKQYTKYGKTYQEYDIGLIILEKEIELLPNKVMTVALPRGNKTFHGKADVAGWGSCSNDSDETSELMQMVSMDIMEKEVCESHLLNPIEKLTYICTTAENKGPCWADSGASLIYSQGSERISIGVHQGNLGQTRTGENAIFVSTGFYADWIKANSEGEPKFIP